MYSVGPPLGQTWVQGGMRYCHLSVFLSSEEKKRRPDGSLGGSSWFPASLGLPWRRSLSEGVFSLPSSLQPSHLLAFFYRPTRLTWLCRLLSLQLGFTAEEGYLEEQKENSKPMVLSSEPSCFLCVEKTRWENERKKYE